MMLNEGCLGDIALKFLDYCKNVHHDNTATVKLVDINAHMLGEGEKRFQKTPYAHSKLKIACYCCHLPLTPFWCT